jgi:hypothetical protein
LGACTFSDYQAILQVKDSAWNFGSLERAGALYAPCALLLAAPDLDPIHGTNSDFETENLFLCLKQ